MRCYTIEINKKIEDKIKNSILEYYSLSENEKWTIKINGLKDNLKLYLPIGITLIGDSYKPLKITSDLKFYLTPEKYYFNNFKSLEYIVEIDFQNLNFEILSIRNDDFNENTIEVDIKDIEFKFNNYIVEYNITKHPQFKVVVFIKQK